MPTPTTLPTHEEIVIAQQAAMKSALRQRIAAGAGDVPTILATTADAAQLLLFEIATMARALSTATSVAEVRAAALPFATLTSDFLDGVAADTIRLPFQVKGVEAVMTDIATRSTAVADAWLPFLTEPSA